MEGGGVNWCDLGEGCFLALRGMDIYERPFEVSTFDGTREQLPHAQCLRAKIRDSFSYLYATLPGFGWRREGGSIVAVALPVSQ